MNNENRYRDFNEEDFVSDPYFQDWVITPNAGSDLFWKRFFEANPAKKEAAENARKVLANLKFSDDYADEMFIEQSFAEHLAAIERLNEHKVIDIRMKFSVKQLLRIAAVFAGALLLLSVFFISTKKDEQVLVKAEFGNIKSVLLPDSSSVVLNGNSTVRFRDNWGKHKRREVWLEGEAFFDVRHINKNVDQVREGEKFIVHTGDLTVEVLGTSFDIRQRRGKTEVVLQKGSIKVSFAFAKTKTMVMEPGDKLSYDADAGRIIMGTTDAANFSAWREKKLLLDDPTVAEVIEYLEDVFGKKLMLANPELGKRVIEGPVQVTSLDDALFVLSTVLDAEIIKNEGTITIRPR